MPQDLREGVQRVLVTPAAPREPLPGDDDTASGLRGRVGLWSGIVLCVAVLLLPAPEGMSEQAWRTTAVATLMAIWWVSEAVPIAATALVPLVLFAPLGILPLNDAASAYGNPVIFLFMGGFIVALAMERWELHRRIAISVVRAMGVRPDRLVLGVMLATGFVSMWVSNTATAVMMLPIALSLVRLQRPDGRPAADAEERNFAVNLLLAVAYAASIGGLGTLIGTPPNALLAGYMLESYGIQIGFGQWMLVGVPLVAVMLPLAWLLLTRVIYPLRSQEIPGGRAALDAEYRKLGPVSPAEKRIAIIFLVTATLWVTRPLLGPYVPGLDDAGIAVAAALATFLIPAGRGQRPLMDWKTAERLPWGALVLYGGGLALAAAVTDSGLAGWIGESVQGFGWSALAMVLTVTVAMIFLTELTSNTATAAAFLPLVTSMAVGLGESPFLLAVPAVIAASCGFMMPVGTPPNAIVYASGHVTMPQMARAGVWLNLACVVAIVAVMYAVGLRVFGVELGVVPEWATGGAP